MAQTHIKSMRFYTDLVALGYSDVATATQWWVKAFDCKVERVPRDWDEPLPSDVAMTLPGSKTLQFS